jgi:hypothetical protein
VNGAFLVFTYFVGVLVLDAYRNQQEQIHERYVAAIKVVDRCIDEAFDGHEAAKHNTAPYGGPR